MIAFISGHTDLSSIEFSTYYHRLIDQAINDNHDFVIGSARGADTFALEYLLSKNVSPTKITIYLYDKNLETMKKLRERYQNFGVNIFDGFTSYTSRDAQMTTVSDYDIAWVRSEEQSKLMYGDAYKLRISGTQLNLDRRKKLSKEANKEA